MSEEELFNKWVKSDLSELLALIKNKCFKGEFMEVADNVKHDIECMQLAMQGE